MTRPWPRAPAFVNEAQECLGGAGYVEESILPRLYRQAPLNSIWEGSGNVQCLDVLRALAREPDTAQVLWNELQVDAGTAHAALVARLEPALRQGIAIAPETARAFVASLALALQGAALARAGSPLVEAFGRSRIGSERGLVFGASPAMEDARALIERLLPA